jgi:hypothetical protein
MLLVVIPAFQMKVDLYERISIKVMHALRYDLGRMLDTTESTQQAENGKRNQFRPVSISRGR